MKMINLGKHFIGGNNPCYFISEIGSNFDGSIERAKKLIDLSIESGADCVKFQSFQTDKIVSSEGFKDLKVSFQSSWKQSVIDVYRQAELPRNWHKILFDYCKEKNITFISTPYDKEAVDDLFKLGVPAFKIGSGDITDLKFINYVASTCLPVILACGASTLGEVEEAVQTILSTGNDQIILLQCTTAYPSTFQGANIRAMKSMMDTFGVIGGMSDHTPKNIVALGAVSLGGSVIEKHFTDDPLRSSGPDHSFAMSPYDFKEMVESVRNLELALGSPMKTLYPEEKETVIIQRRCIRVSRDIKKGEIINQNDLVLLRPAPPISIYPKHVPLILGRQAKQDIIKGSHLTWEMI